MIYEVREKEESLGQGDIFERCPLLYWIFGWYFLPAYEENPEIDRRSARYSYGAARSS